MNVKLANILKQLKQHDEYHYPAYDCSLFMLPDGSMFGMRGVLQHNSMLKLIFKQELIFDEFINIMTEAKLIRIVVKYPMLQINIITSPTSSQITALRGLVECGKYENFFIDSFPNKDKSLTEARLCRLLNVSL